MIAALSLWFAFGAFDLASHSVRFVLGSAELRNQTRLNVARLVDDYGPIFAYGMPVALALLLGPIAVAFSVYEWVAAREGDS
ncbi:MAG TPA: hypothetical protein VK989_13255 [Polyangia bacterium]|nr:hypothetical protein [Polyangia bacterium]